MDLSMKWLSDFVDLNGMEMKTFCDGMTMSGSKTEGWHQEGSEVTNTVVGRILKTEKHPDADRLTVCQVDVGELDLQIITAATNVFEGALVPVARDGATLVGGIKIKSGKLRGLPSEGMFCSVAELGVTVNDYPGAIADGILIIDEKDCPCKPGDDIHDALGLDDKVVEFEITSNRADCLSVIGLAREAAATFGVPFEQPQLPDIENKQPLKLFGDKNEEKPETINDFLKVEVKNDQLCSRYAAKMVRNVKIGPSPLWLRQRLRASGVRPINNLVDITNFVCLEYGHPMHAFDYRYVKGGKIVVRNAKEGESITTLEGVCHPLSPEMLVIADALEPSAVAGVMGGEYSGIMEDTDTVIFEAACFNGASVRKTARKLGLRTESSARFEKGLPEENALFALARACQLVELLGAGEVVDGLIDVYPHPKKPVKLSFDPDYINEFIGFDVADKEQANILRSLGFEIKLGQVIVPYFRTDIFHKSDLAEEVARIYGYERIPSTLVRGAAQAILSKRELMTDQIHELLVAKGMYEIMTYSFISPKYYDKIRMAEDDPARKSVTLRNPLGEDTSVMRTTALPGMLEVIARNHHNRNDQGSFYEIATEYHPVEDQLLPNEPQMIILGQYGKNYDFFTLKGIVEELLAALRCKNVRFVANRNNPTYHPGRCADVYLGDTLLGTFGQLHPLTAQNYDLDCPVFAGRLSLELLLAQPEDPALYKPLPKFPKVTRDLALVCDVDLPVADLEDTIKTAGGKLVTQVALFDVYQGEQVQKGKKSVAYSIVLQSDEKTLTDEECEQVMKRILKRLEILGATIRS